jgi:23S rRNA pseudouridine1911/1915/1917 synthase
MTPSKEHLPGSFPRPGAFSHRWRVDSASHGESLAFHLSRQLLIPENEASDLIDFGSVHIGGKIARGPARLVSEGEDITVNLPWRGARRFYEIDPGRILYRDPFLLAYDKEAGTPAQQTPSDAYNNLYAALYRYLRKEAPSPYLALHHRLDKETSGVMLLAIDRSVNRRLGKAFETRAVEKLYLVLVGGNPPADEWTATEDIGRKGGKYRTVSRGEGKHAETLFKVIRRGNDESLIEARPLTGRTHQIRLHLAKAGHPVLGDTIYGGRSAKRLFLHAHRLMLRHPKTDDLLSLMAPLPDGWPLPLPLGPNAAELSRGAECRLG